MKFSKDSVVAHAVGMLMLILLMVVLASAQTQTKAPQQKAATPAPKAAPAPPAQKAATPPAAGAPARGGQPAAPPAAPLAPKGFARLDVTADNKVQFETERRVAIIVAPSYRNSGLNALRFTYLDALELQSEFQRQGYLVRLVAPTEATADNIRKVLEDAKQQMDGTNQGTLLFAFSGHGFQTEKGNYLVTVGVTEDQVERDALGIDEVESLMKASGARRRIILVDACRNNPDAKSAATSKSFNDFKEAEGTTILLSTRPGGFSYEDPDLGHGIFSYYVLEGLRGKAASKDGYVTFYDLQKYVSTSVESEALKKDRVQRPFIKGESYGDFLMATTAPPKPGDIAPLPQAAQELDSNSPVLFTIGGGPSYFASLRGDRLTLIDNKRFIPVVELSEKDAKDITPGYKRFQGIAPNKELFDVAVKVEGNDIQTVNGRIGAPCPNDTQCSTPKDVPPLPGEKLVLSQTAEAANKAKDVGSKIGNAIGSIRGNKTPPNDLKKGVQTADATKEAANSTNSLLKYRWRPFDLTTNIPKQAAR